MDEVIEKFVRMCERTSVLLAVYDQFDRLRYANVAFRSAYFIEEGEAPLWPDLMRRNFLARRGTVIRAANFDEWLISTQSRRGKTGFRAFETDLVDGRWLWMTETVCENGWMLCIASEIGDLHSDTRAIRQDRDFAVKASYTDELTGVANRRFVMARIEDMLRQQNGGYGTTGCLAVLDIDHFKKINDRFGHQMGDMVLRDFARHIHAHVRRTDCFGRVGGEEFVLVLPKTPSDEAALILERMLVVVRASRPFSDHPDFGYTFSAGVAETLSGDISVSLYARADKALYAAKIGGRDRLRVADTYQAKSAAHG